MKPFSTLILTACLVIFTAGTHAAEPKPNPNYHPGTTDNTALANAERRPAANPYPMPLGVDDAGAQKAIFQDPRMAEAFETIGFDFLMFHLHAENTVELNGLSDWAKRTSHDFILNQENTSRPPGDPTFYRQPGFFYQPAKEFLARAIASQHFLGVCYDEAEHWVNQGVWITGHNKPFAPHFHDAESETVAQAYAGNLYNLQTLMQSNYPGFATPASGRTGPIVCTEHVFPAMFHVFARAGISPMPKLLKETVTPVAAGLALGCVRQYGTKYWPCLDLWGPTLPALSYPNHSPAELSSALLFAYWTGAERAYIENFNYQGSLYSVTNNHVQLSAWGEAVRVFKHDYLPFNPRAIRAEDFAPEIVILRFPDTDWGQISTSYTRTNLYGASNLIRDWQTSYWIRIWHVISHGTIPTNGLNWNAGFTIPYRFFFPANNVAVYDHLAADPKLFATAKLVFLTGKEISPICQNTLSGLVNRGLTVVTPSYLVPLGMKLGGEVVKVYPTGLGRWIVTDQVDNNAVATLLRPFLGSPDQMRFVFGRTEVIFRQDVKGNLTVEQSPLP